MLGVMFAACGGSSEPPAPIATVSLVPANDTLLVSETVTLAATLRDASDNVLTGRTVTWLSNRPAVASVSEAGLVTGLTDGEATITASAEGKSGAATIHVLGPCSTLLAPSIVIGQTINGALATTDCKLDDNTFADGYAIGVTTLTNAQIDLTASSFDTYLILLELLPNGDLEERAVNDDLDPDDPNDPNDPFNTNSRITFPLAAGAEYFILANSFETNVTGNYTLSVSAVSAFIAGREGDTKPGKAPITTLLKSLRRR